MFLKISQYSQENTCLGAASVDSRAAIFQESLALTLKWNALTSEIFKNSSFYRTPLMAGSGFFIKPAENNYAENHFSVEVFSEIFLA